MKKIFTIALIFSIIFTGCRKNDSPAASTDGVVIAKEVKVISNQVWNDNIVSLDSTTNTLIFKNGISATQQFKNGDILVSAVGEGLLQKVISVSTVNNQIKLETVPASLTECIKQGVIDINQPLTVNQIKRIDYHYNGISLVTDGLKSGGNSPINLAINTSVGDHLKLNGTLNCDWGFNLHIDISALDGLKEVKFGVTGTENLDLQFIAGNQYQLKKEVSLATVHFTPIITTIGALPVVIVPELDIVSVRVQLATVNHLRAGVSRLRATST